MRIVIDTDVIKAKAKKSNRKVKKVIGRKLMDIGFKLSCPNVEIVEVKELKA